MKWKKQNLGFTLIEAMVVVFIIGLFSLIAALGYGTATRQKILDQAGRKISSALDRARNYSIFGQKVGEDAGDKYPCGYGISIENGKSRIEKIYTSWDRLNAINTDTTCDEVIKSGSGNNIQFENTGDDSGSDLEGVMVEKITNSSGADVNCLTVLFSVPRGMSYYCTTCPPKNCSALQTFSEEIFTSTLKINQEGSSSENKAYVKVYPNGNVEIVQQ